MVTSPSPAPQAELVNHGARALIMMRGVPDDATHAGEFMKQAWESANIPSAANPLEGEGPPQDILRTRNRSRPRAG
jgi:hypothetical protein